MNTAATEVLRAGSLPAPVERRGITDAQWRTLSQNLYPGAASESVLMVWDYCKARKLDPLKKPVHIVPMSVKNAKTGKYDYRDVVIPGIYEYRTTAMRTGLYMGHSKPEYGAEIEYAGGKAPEWCELVVYRWSAAAAQKIEFPVRVYFREIAALKDAMLNKRWGTAPIQMLTKCTEAAGLREAFPDEFGGEHTFEELVDREIDITPTRDRKGPSKSAAAALDEFAGAGTLPAPVNPPANDDAHEESNGSNSPDPRG